MAIDMAISFSKVYDMFILCLDEPGTWASIAKQRGIPVYSLNRRPGIDWKIPGKLKAFAKKNRIDLFHAHQYTPWFYAVLSRIIYPRVKLLFQEHGRHYPEIKKTKRKLINRSIFQHMTAACTAVSKDIKHRLVFYEGIAPIKIKTIYNGVHPINQCSLSKLQGFREKFNFKSTDVVMGTIGRMDPIKNLPLFLEGFKGLTQKYSNLKGLIVGDGPLMPFIKTRIKQLGLEHHIVLTGFRSDATLLVQMMDIFTLTSFSEGTSMALLEAMACGIPAIVTDVGGNPEIVEDQKTGWVVPSNDLNGLKSALKDAISNPEKRIAMGKAAKKRYKTQFTFEIMLKSYQKLYGNILESQ